MKPPVPVIRRIRQPDNVPLTVNTFNVLIREARQRIASADALDATVSRHPTLPHEMLRDPAFMKEFREHETGIRLAFTNAMEVALFGASHSELTESWAMDITLPATLGALEKSLHNGFLRVEAELEDLFREHPRVRNAAEDIYVQITEEMMQAAETLICKERVRSGNGR